MKVFDRHQEKIAKSTLKLSDAGCCILGGMSKPQAICVLRQNGYSYEKITKLLSDAGHNTKEIQQIFLSAIRG